MGLDDFISDVAGSVWGWVSELPGEAIRAGTGILKGVYAPIGLVNDLATAGDDAGSFAQQLRDRGTVRFGESLEALFGGKYEDPETGEIRNSSGLGALFDMAPEAVRAPVRSTVMPVLDTLDQFSEDYIHEPITAALLAGGLNNGDHYAGSLLDSKTWKDAYTMAQEDVSLGQAVYLMITAGDITDEDRVAEVAGTPWFDVVSGTLDFTKHLFLEADVLVAGGVGAASKAAFKIPSKQTFRQAYFENPTPRMRAVGATWERTNETVNRVLERAGMDVAAPRRQKALDELEQSTKQSKLADKELERLIESDTGAAQFIMDARESGLDSFRIYQHAKEASEVVRRNGSWDDLSTEARDYLDSQIMNWLRSSTNTSFHGAMAIRRLAESSPAPGRTLYRGVRYNQAEIEHRGTIAALRGGTYLDDAPAEILQAGDEIRFGLASFSGNPEKAAEFGRDTTFVIDNPDDAPAFDIPEHLDRQAGLGEDEYIVSGRFEVLGKDNVPRWAELNSVEYADIRDFYHSAGVELGDITDEILDKFYRLPEDVQRQIIQTENNLDPVKLQNMVLEAGLTLDAVPLDRLNDFHGDDFTQMMIRVDDGRISTVIVKRGDTGEVRLRYKGPIEDHFQPDNVDRIHDVERQAREAKEKAASAYVDAENAGIEELDELTRGLFPTLEEQNQLGSLHADLLHTQGQLKQVRDQDLRGRPWGSQLFRKPDGGYDFESFRSGGPVQRENFLKSIEEYFKSDEALRLVEDRVHQRREAEGFEDDLDALASLSDLEGEASFILAQQAQVAERLIRINDRIKLGEEIVGSQFQEMRQLFDELMREIEEWHKVGTSEDLRLARERSQKVNQAVNEGWLRIRKAAEEAGGYALLTSNTIMSLTAQIQTELNLINAEYPPRQVNPFRGTLADIYDTGLKRRPGAGMEEIGLFGNVQDFMLTSAQGTEMGIERLQRINDYRQELYEARKRDLDAKRETRRVYDAVKKRLVEERADIAGAEIGRQLFPDDPYGAQKGRLLALAPDDESRKWVMKTLMGDSGALQEMKASIESFRQRHDLMRELQRELAEKRADDLAVLGPEYASGAKQLNLDFDVERHDRIVALRDELMRWQLNSNVPRRFASTWDRGEAARLVDRELQTPADLEAMARDVGRQLGAFELLDLLSETQDIIPRRTMGATAGAKLRGGANLIRQTRIYRTGAIGGRVVRVVMSPFDKVALPIVDLHDAHSASQAAKNGLRQAGASEALQNKYETLLSDPSLTPGQRGDILDDAISAGYREIGKEYGIPEEHLKDTIEKATRGRKRAIHELEQSSRYGTDGRDTWNAENGIDIHVRPVFETQVADQAMMPNFTGLKRDLERLRRKELLFKDAGEWQRYGNAARDLMDQINYYVKMNLIVRPTWPLRVIGLDEGLRPLAIFGGIASMKGWYRNVSRVRARLAEKNPNFLRMSEEGKAAKGLSLATAGAAGAIVGGLPGAAIAAGASAGWRLARNLGFLDEAGYKGVEIESRFGKQHFDGVLEGKGSEQAKRLSIRNSLDEIFANETPAKGKLIGNPRAWRTVVPSDSHHLATYTDALNNKVGKSAIGRQALEGKTAEEIADWLEGTVDGQKLLEEFPVQGADPLEWGHRVVGEVENLTQGHPDLIEAALQGKVTKNLIERVIPDDAARPNVNGPELDYAVSGGMGSVINKFINSFVDTLVEIPSDELVRVPMFELYYKRELKRLVDRAGEEGRIVDGRIDDATRKAWEQKARDKAFHQTKAMIYEFAAKSEFHQMVRFISPFFAAMEEAWRRWANIAIDHPARTTVGINLWRKLNDNDLVEEDDQGERWLHIPMPESARKLLKHGAFAHVATADKVGIPINSLNLITDTDFASGPVGRLAASEILKRQPQMEESLKWAVPFGIAGDAGDALLGGMLSNLRDYIQKEGSDEYLATHGAVLTQMLADVHSGKREYNLNVKSDREKFLADVDTATNQLYHFKIFVSGFSPAPVVPFSPYKPLIDAARELKNKDPENWFQKFYEQYGEDAVAVGLGITKTTNGIPPTQHGLRQFKEFEGLISEYPGWGSFIVGDDPGSDSASQFSNAVYEWQKRQPAEPGSRDRMRQFKSDQELIEEPEIRIGWHEYIKLMDHIDGQLAERGLVSIGQKGAEDLREMKKGAVAYLYDQYPAWQREHQQIDLGAWDKKLQGAREIVADPRMKDRGDVQAMRSYLEIREYFLNEVRKRGEARSLRTVANQDLYGQFLQVVGHAGNTDPAFAAMYYRYFESDPLKLED